MAETAAGPQSNEPTYQSLLGKPPAPNVASGKPGVGGNTTVAGSR